MADLFNFAAAAAFAIIFGVTAVSYLQRRIAPRLDATVLFGVLALATLGFALDVRAINHIFAVVLVGAAYLQPWLLLRMARHFRPLKGPWIWLSLVLAIANLVVLGLYGVRSLPAWAPFLALVHYAFGNGIAITIFLAEARRGGAASNQRMAIGAAASIAFLAAVLARTGADLSGSQLVADAGTLAMIAMAVGYPLAFAAPRGIRRMWHLATVQRFSDNLHDSFADMDTAQVRQKLHEGVADALGCTTFLLDMDHPVEGPIARALQRKLDAYGDDALSLPPERVPDEFKQQADGKLYGMHIVAIEQQPLVLAVVQDRASLFPEEDLELIRLMGVQTSLALAQVEVLDARQKEFERTKELESFKSMFLRSVGHELANPLSPVRLQLRALQRQELNDKGKRSLEIIGRNVERLRRLITDMSTVAKLQDAKLDLAMEPMDLAGLVKEACTVQDAPAKEGGCTIQMDMNGALPVQADKERIGQVLDNLLSNAIKYSPEGGTIRVSARSRNGMAFVKVDDEGLGLTKEQQDKMFGLYERFHKGSNPKIPGTGLGLAIVKGIVESHGGTIGVASEGPGKGTSFSIEIPLAT